MNGWLVINGFLKSRKFNDLYRLLSDAFLARGMSLATVKNTEFASPLGDPLTPLRPLKVRRPDFVLFWDKDAVLAQRLEEAGIPVFNSAAAIACCDDKILTARALVRAGVPTPRTVVAPKTFEGIGRQSMDFLQDATKTLGFPLVVKEACGSFGQQVYLARTIKEARDIIKQIGHKDFLMQEFIEESFGEDLRLNIVGGKVVAAMRRFNKTDFRSNVTLGGNTEPFMPTIAQRDAAIAACKAVGTVFAGVDILFGPGGIPLVCEVNSNPHFRSTLDCTGVNMAIRLADWLLHRLAGRPHRCTKPKR